VVAVAHLVFAKAFRRHVDCPDAEVGGTTLREAFDDYFGRYPAVRSYVLDDAASVRRHVAVFVDDELIADRAGLSDPIGPDARLHVFQALSGGCT
jgi:molybdopterin synthase sulfur carrier subunit